VAEDGSSPLPPSDPRSVAAKLEFLIDHYRGPGGHRLTYKEIARRTQQDGRTGISPAYVHALHRGTKPNPTLEAATALAAAFGVHPAYFFRDRVAEEVQETTRQTRALKSVQGLMLRAEAASPEAVEAIAAFIARVVEERPPDGKEWPGE
jgi:transcriptional regulator with XRE-family HTH domain